MGDGVLKEDGDPDNYVPPIPDHFDQLFKVILVGESGVGKSSILTRFKERDLSNGIIEVTGGVVFNHVIFPVDSKIIKFQVWDSGGQDRFRPITRIHFKNKDAFLVFYDVTDRLSFDCLPTWYSGMEKFTENGAIIILIANKCDNAENRQVTRDEGKLLAAQLKAPYIETSAITGINVDIIFQLTARMLMAGKSGNAMPSNSIFV